LPDFDLILPSQNQANPNKIAWISLDSFGRIGTFQWVTANPNKKFLFLGQRVGGHPQFGRLYAFIVLAVGRHPVAVP
jgi:hypothetical protein